MILTVFVRVFLLLGRLFFQLVLAGWVLFSTESLILAQDERWRRA
jgi:hypothetical protein